MSYKFRTGGSYEKEWKRVDSLQNKGLTKSALEIVTAIYTKAKAEKNTNNFIRAIIERMKFESYIEEDSYVKAIGDLEKEAAEAAANAPAEEAPAEPETPEVPAEAPAEAPAEEAPVEAPMEEPAEAPAVETPAEVPAEEPVEAPAEANAATPDAEAGDSNQ